MSSIIPVQINTVDDIHTCLDEHPTVYLIPKMQRNQPYYTDPSVIAELFDYSASNWVPIRSGDWIFPDEDRFFVHRAHKASK